MGLCGERASEWDPKAEKQPQESSVSSRSCSRYRAEVGDGLQSPRREGSGVLREREQEEVGRPRQAGLACAPHTERSGKATENQHTAGGSYVLQNE